MTVADLDASLAACLERGGSVVQAPRDLGMWGRLAVIRDPAGATTALVQPQDGDEEPKPGA